MWPTVFAEQEQREVGAAEVGGGQAHDAVVAVQEHPGEVLHVAEAPLPHLHHNRQDVRLLQPDEHEADGAQPGQGQPTEVGHRRRTAATAAWHLPAWVDQNALQNGLKSGCW